MRGSRSPRPSRCATAASSPSEPTRTSARLAGPATRVIDARGRTVIPGLIDSHVHALGAAPVEAVTPFRTLASIAEVQDWLRDVARRTAGAVMGVVHARLSDAVARGAIPDATGTRRRRAGSSGGGGWRVRVRPEYAGPRGRRHHRRHARSAGGGHRAWSGRRTHRLAAERGEHARALPPGRTRHPSPLDQIEALHRAYLATGITSIVERGGSVGGLSHLRSVSRPRGRLHIRSTITLMLPTGLRAEQADAAVASIAPRATCGGRLAEGRAAEDHRRRRHPARHVVHARTVPGVVACAVRRATAVLPRCPLDERGGHSRGHDCRARAWLADVGARHRRCRRGRGARRLRGRAARAGPAPTRGTR